MSKYFQDLQKKHQDKYDDLRLDVNPDYDNTTLELVGRKKIDPVEEERKRQKAIDDVRKHAAKLGFDIVEKAPPAELEMSPDTGF